MVRYEELIEAEEGREWFLGVLSGIYILLFFSAALLVVGALIYLAAVFFVPVRP